MIWREQQRGSTSSRGTCQGVTRQHEASLVLIEEIQLGLEQHSLGELEVHVDVEARPEMDVPVHLVEQLGVQVLIDVDQEHRLHCDLIPYAYHSASYSAVVGD